MPRALNNDKPVFSLMRQYARLESYIYVSYVIRILPQLNVIGYDYGYVLLRQSPPVANISGVSVATKGEGNITLDGSRSYDPHPDKSSPLTFTWFCRRSQEVLPEDDSLPVPVVDTPNGDQSVSGGCYGYGPGRLSGHEKIINVDVDKMEEGQTYIFELLVSNGVKSSMASHLLMVVQQRTLFFIR